MNRYSSSSYESNGSSYFSSPSHDNYLSETSKTPKTQNMEYDEERTKNDLFHLEKETNCETQIEENTEYHENSCDQQNYNKSVHDEGVEEPRVGMIFDTIEELTDFYATYLECSKDLLKSLKLMMIKDCGARVSVVIRADKRCHVSKVNLEHNHHFSLSKGRFYRCHRVVNKHVKRQLEIHQRAGVRMNKCFNTFVVQSRGYEDLPFTEKDCRNHIDKVKRLTFGEGDAESIQGYFMKVQSTDREFFYAWDLDEENRLKSLFWADARYRAAYEELGDVVTFDTTYLTNKYEMPMAPFVGVNHHGQSILLGCGLISNGDTKTFTWLFRTWLTYVGRRYDKMCTAFSEVADLASELDEKCSLVLDRLADGGDEERRWCGSGGDGDEGGDDDGDVVIVVIGRR
nr:hypothetical protein [Tanacetum cinerariifolium]